jgi:hypothetical protein
MPQAIAPKGFDHWSNMHLPNILLHPAPAERGIGMDKKQTAISNKIATLIFFNLSSYA